MIELNVLGSARLSADGNTVGSVLSQPKRLALLTYLAVAAPEGFVRRDRLLPLFWPESDERHARSSLSESLSRLRSSLGPDVIVTRGSDEVGINATNLQSDVWNFRRAVKEGRDEEAALLYRGPLMDGFILDIGSGFDMWLEATRASLARSAVSVLGTLSDRAFERGDERAIAWAERARAIAPLDGDSAVRLMKIMASAGHRADAIREFERFRTRLELELDMQPSEEVIAVAESIRAGQTAWRASNDVIAAPPPSDEASREPGGPPTAAPPVLDLAANRSADARASQEPVAAASPSAAPPAAVQPRRPGEPSVPGRTASSGWMGLSGLMGWIVAGITLLSLGFVTSRRTPPAVPVRADLDVGPLGLGGFLMRSEVTVSADGRRFAVVLGTPTDSLRGLYVRGADESDFRLIPGTTGANSATFAPDGESLAYADWGRDALVIVRLPHGEEAFTGTVGHRPENVHWGSDGFIAYDDGRRIYLAPETGGNARLVAESPAHDLIDPHLVPGGRFALVTNRTLPAVEVVDLQAGERRLLVEGGFDATFVAATGHMLYADTTGTLWAVDFDRANGSVTGESRRVRSGLSTVMTDFARYSVSETGVLVYTAGHRRDYWSLRRFVTLSLDGRVLDDILGPRFWQGASWSPDGATLAFHAVAEASNDPDRKLHVYDGIRGGAPRRLDLPGDNRWPEWSPDGTRLALSTETRASNGRDVYMLDLAAGESVTPVIEWHGDQRPLDWPEADALIFGSGNEFWVADLSHAPDTVITTMLFRGEEPAVDFVVAPGRDLVALVTGRFGEEKIFLTSYPEVMGTRFAANGLSPQWSPDGSILYFVTTDGAAVASVPVEREQELRIGEPRRLFDWPGFRSIELHPSGAYVLGAGAQPPTAAPTPPDRHHVVTNWFVELRRLMS